MSSLSLISHTIRFLFHINVLIYLVADVLYDFGTGLEVMSPLCAHLFLEMACLGNFAKVISFGWFFYSTKLYACWTGFDILMVSFKPDPELSNDVLTFETRFSTRNI